MREACFARYIFGEEERRRAIDAEEKRSRDRHPGLPQAAQQMVLIPRNIRVSLAVADAVLQQEQLPPLIVGRARFEQGCAWAELPDDPNLAVDANCRRRIPELL